MLYARMVDATIPHGRIASIDTSAAEKLPGVRAVHVIEHVYGVAQLRDPKQEVPFPLSSCPLCRTAYCRHCRYFTADRRRCSEAGKGEYDAIPFVVDRSDARAEDAPMVFPGPADEGGSAGGGGGPKGVPQKGNVHGPQRKIFGDPKRVLPKPT